MSTTQQDDRRPRRLDAYIRVSQVSGREGDSFLSPGDQEKRIRAWAVAHGHEIGDDGPDDGVWRELDISAGEMDRAKLNEILRRIEDGETDGLVVYNLSRFARTFVGTMEIIKRINARNALFASVQDSFDITTVNGRMVFGILLSISTAERERSIETYRSSRAQAIDRGVSLAPTPPFGYRRVCGGCGGEIRPGSRRDRAVCLSCNHTGTGVLVPEEPGATAVGDLFRRRAGGHSWSSLCDWLNDELGLRTRRGKRFSHAVVMGMISNRTYLGESGGGHAGDPPKRGAHLALIDEPTWYAAQQDRRMGEDRGGRPTVASGLVRCAGCRYTMSAVRTSDAHAQYKCRRTLQARDCPDPSTIVAIAANGSYKLDDYVVEEFFAHQERIAFEAVDVDLQDLANRREAARRELAETEDNTELYREMGAQRFGKLVARLGREFDALEEEWEEANATAGGGLGMTVAELRELWSTLPLDVRRRHLANAIQHVFVRPAPEGTRNLAFVRDDPARNREYYSSRVRIVWADDDPVDTPRRGVAGYVIVPFTDFSDWRAA